MPPNAHPIAIVIGNQGQDGYYLSNLLQDKGYEVIGLGKNSAFKNQVTPIKPIDIIEKEQVAELLRLYQPQELYYFAAYHRSSETSPVDTFSELKQSYTINVLGLLNFLNAIEQHCPTARLFYAASSHIFGDPTQVPQTETTPFRPICPYGITKSTGVEMCRLYRKNHGVFASTGILYNHESPRRNTQFVSKKIIQTAVKIKQGRAQTLVLGDLEAKADWGLAQDYVTAMHKILQIEEADDFIIATGKLHTIQEFADCVFEILDLKGADYIKVDRSLISKPKRTRDLVGDASKLAAKTGWSPAVNFNELVQHLVQTELELSLKEGAL